MEFNLKGVFAMPMGKTSIKLKSTKEEFILNKPLTSVHNLIIGTMYIWSQGDCYCKNQMTGHQAHFYLKPKGYDFWGKTDYPIEGEITDENEKITHKIDGKWSDEINAFEEESEK